MRHEKTAMKALCVLLSLLFLLPLAPDGAYADSPNSAALPATSIPDPKITASAAVVMDYETGELLYAKDPDTMRPPASMTKVMTAYIVYEELHKGTFTMDTQVPISNYVAKISRDSVNYQMTVPLPYGGTVPVKTLMRLILIYSASASCVAMAEFISGTEAAFVQRMNDTAARLGLDAQYINPHGHKLNYISPRSQAQLIRLFIQQYPDVLEITSEESVYFNGRDYETTNKLLPGGEYAYEGVDGFKTGYIRASGYCQSVTGVKNGHRLITVAMNSSSGVTRQTDNVKLLDYGFARIAELEQQHFYNDIQGHPAEAAIRDIVSKGVETHPSFLRFRPNDNVTRAEFTAMLYSALMYRGAYVYDRNVTASPFTDTSGHWAATYIALAAQKGLFGDSAGGVFVPDSPMTREDIMVMIDRALILPDKNGLNFSDVSSISFDALTACARVAASGIVTGSDGKLDPQSPVTRGEAAQIISRVTSW